MNIPNEVEKHSAFWLDHMLPELSASHREEWAGGAGAGRSAESCSSGDQYEGGQVTQENDPLLGNDETPHIRSYLEAILSSNRPPRNKGVTPQFHMLERFIDVSQVILSRHQRFVVEYQEWFVKILKEGKDKARKDLAELLCNKSGGLTKTHSPASLT